MKPVRILLFACALAMPLHAAEAQLLFGNRLGQTLYQGEDTKVIMQVASDMLRNAPDGETRNWSNPQTGHKGEITLVRSYTMKGMPCRDTRVDSLLDDRRVSYVLPICRTGDGSWKIAAR